MELKSLKKRLYGELVFEELKYHEYVYFHAGPRSKQHKTCGNEIKNNKGIREFSQKKSVEVYSMHHLARLSLLQTKLICVFQFNSSSIDTKVFHNFT